MRKFRNGKCDMCDYVICDPVGVTENIIKVSDNKLCDAEEDGKDQNDKKVDIIKDNEDNDCEVNKEEDNSHINSLKSRKTA